MQSKESNRRAGRGGAAVVIGLTVAAIAVVALAAPLAHERGAPMGPMPMGQISQGMGGGMMGQGMGGGMMMGQRGQMGQGMGGGMGGGMMGPGTSQGMGPGTMKCPMMGRGMMMGQMGQMGQMGRGMGGPMGGGMMMGPGMGAGMMTGPGIGPGWIYGAPGPVARRLSAEDVRTDLDRRLAWHGNKRLKLGTVAEKDDSTVTAEIVTVDGSLVQRLEIDRRTGQMWRTD